MSLLVLIITGRETYLGTQRAESDFTPLGHIQALTLSQVYAQYLCSPHTQVSACHSHKEARRKAKTVERKNTYSTSKMSRRCRDKAAALGSSSGNKGRGQIAGIWVGFTPLMLTSDSQETQSDPRGLRLLHTLAAPASMCRDVPVE